MSSWQNVMAEEYSESVSYKCWQGKAETELYHGRKYIKALSYLNNFAKMLRDARFRQHRLNNKKIYNRKNYNIKKLED